MTGLTRYQVDDWVHTDERDRGTGRVMLELGGGLLRVRFARTEATVRIGVLRPATDEETAAAQELVR